MRRLLVLTVVVHFSIYLGWIDSGFSQTYQADTLPPVPGSLLQRVLKERHPFLLATYDQFREARSVIHRDFIEDRGEEFKQRVVGYFNPDSRWYIGEGPLSEKKNFRPSLLTDSDFITYTKIVCEVLCFAGIEKDRWSTEGLKREFVRLLDDIQPQSGDAKAPYSNGLMTDRKIKLLSLASLTYDIVYHRFDTKDRHSLNNRLNQIRTRLAAACASADSASLSPQQRIERGTALGLSTLLCISIYPHEWEKQRRFSVQSFLPDLYRAITYTHEGLKDVATSSPRFFLPLDSLESMLLTTIPWLESMDRLGYPYRIAEGLYEHIFHTFETHRIPGSPEMLHPYIPDTLYDPWIPFTQPVFLKIDASMYKKKEDSTQTFTPFSQITKGSSSTTRQSNPTSSSIQPFDVNIQRDGVRTLSLREQLERYGFPRKPTPTPRPSLKPPPNPRAGWYPPKNLSLPTIWGAVYLLAEKENPSSNAGDIWENLAMEIDSHPYTFLGYKEFSLSGPSQEKKRVVLTYPETQAILFSSRANRGQFLFASQSAKATLILPTYAIDHESFLLSEGHQKWRWFHEIPSSTEVVSHPSESNATTSVQSPTPLITSLFTCWQTYSPVGKTIVIRRHLEGIGSAYTAVAHFPESASPSKRVRYLIFSVPEKGNVLPDPDASGLYHLFPSEEDLPTRSMNFALWRMEQNQERKGNQEKPRATIFNLLFAPDSFKPIRSFEGQLGKILEAEPVHPEQPFFYLGLQEMPGREMFTVKFDSIPMPGLRVIEWKQGIELIAIKTGDKIQNPFVESDADIVIAIRDRSMKGLFYLMVNGSYLRCKFSPTQKSFLLLAETKGKKTTLAWCRRRLHTLEPPPTQSVFYAPGVLGFECPGFVVQYGQKGRQAVVWGKKPVPKRPF